MASNLKVIFLFLWLLQCEGGDFGVKQKPPIQVALFKEGTSIPCEVKFPYVPKYTKFTIFYYWINSLGQKISIYNRSETVIIPPGKENETATISYDHGITPLGNTFSTGTYYCEVEWNGIREMGKGVFVLARGTGYVETSYGWEILITILFAALSVTATVLLLWKRKQELCPRRNQLNILRQKVETQPPSASPPPPPPPPPLYDCLDLHQVDVYSILENNTNNPSPRKGPPGKTPKKQATLEESFDTLYENI